MRVVTWNAGRGQFSKKAPWIDHLQADIAVIQEIARPRAELKGVSWFGLNPNQGVAVIAGPPYSATPLPEKSGVPSYIVPFQITGPVEFTLFAVWTLGDQNLKYVRAATAAIELYDDAFRNGPVVFMGDFNSNAIWDGDHPKHLNDSAMVEKLAAQGLGSAFHAMRGVPHGSESEPTFFLHKNPSKGYHIDYCFMPFSWLDRLKHVAIGTHAAWYRASDHTPLLVEIAVAASLDGTRRVSINSRRTGVPACVHEQLDSGNRDFGVNAANLVVDSYKPKKTTAMIDYSWSEFSRVRLQFAQDKSMQGITDNQVTLQYIMSLGAHGAHKF